MRAGRGPCYYTETCRTGFEAPEKQLGLTTKAFFFFLTSRQSSPRSKYPRTKHLRRLLKNSQVGSSSECFVDPFHWSQVRLWWYHNELVLWPWRWDGLFRQGWAFLSALDTTTTIWCAHQKPVGSHALLLRPMCFLGNLEVEEELYHWEFEQLLCEVGWAFRARATFIS